MALLSRLVVTGQRLPSSSLVWIDLCAARPFLSLAAFATGAGPHFNQHTDSPEYLTAKVCVHQLPAHAVQNLATAPWTQTCDVQLANLRRHFNAAHAGTCGGLIDRTATHFDRRLTGAAVLASAASSSIWQSPFDACCGSLQVHKTGLVHARRTASTGSGTSQRVPISDAAHGDSRKRWQNGQPDAPPADKQVLYRGKGIVLFRVLVRLKVFQLLGIAGISVVGATLLSGGPVATLQMGVLTALVAGCGIASASLWYFSRRYLGEISLSPSHPGQAKFSVLDFWGRREDILIPYENIVPTLGALSPAAAAELAQQPLIPIRVTSDNRQYLLSWRHGHLLQRGALRDLLEGRLV